MEITINRAEKPRCPYCHESVSGGRQYQCKECQAIHHLECWDEKGGCSTCEAQRTQVGMSISPPAPAWLAGPVPMLPRPIQQRSLVWRTLIRLAKFLRLVREPVRQRHPIEDMTVVNRLGVMLAQEPDPTMLWQPRQYEVAECVLCHKAIHLVVRAATPVVRQIPRCGRCGCWMHPECFEKSALDQTGGFTCPTATCRGDRSVDWFMPRIET